MSAVPALVCVGRVVREMIYYPSEIRGPVLGSPPAYCSVAAARQGTRTGIVTKIGPEITDSLLQPLLDAGVDTTGICRTERSTCSELVYDARGNKEIRYPSMADSIRAEDIPPSYRDADLIYVCPMDEDVPLPDLAGVVASARLSAVDLGGYGGVHMSKARRLAHPSLRRLARDVSAHFDIVKASDEDAASFMDYDDPERAAGDLYACGPQVVLITLGKQGILLRTASGQRHVPAVPGQVMDTTGGGDTFMAGFLSEYLRNGDARAASRWGCATASWVIERSGGVRAERMPTRDEINSRLKSAPGVTGERR